MKILAKFTPFLIVIHLIYFMIAIFTPSTLSATATLSPLLAASDLQLPEKPKPPLPPTTPKSHSNEKAVEQQPPANQQPIKSPKQSQSTQLDDEKKPSPKPVSDTKSQSEAPSTSIPATSTTNNMSTINNTQDESVAKAVPSPKKSDTFFNNFITYSLYSILILSIIICTGYLYFTTPKDRPKQRTSLPTKQTSTSTLPLKTDLTSGTMLNDIKITNRSLLEQLIKYDLDTYGEIRTNLDYEQPAYVEKLIRKHCGHDKAKLNHAIQLFYQNRNRK